jgi:hypothetical protein
MNFLQTRHSFHDKVKSPGPQLTFWCDRQTLNLVAGCRDFQGVVFVVQSLGGIIFVVGSLGVKGFILPQCCCMETQHRPNRMQIIKPTMHHRRSRTNPCLPLHGLSHCLPEHSVLTSGWLQASLCHG